MTEFADLVSGETPHSWTRLVDTIWTWLPPSRMFVSLPSQHLDVVRAILWGEGYRPVVVPRIALVLQTWGGIGMLVHDSIGTESVFWATPDEQQLAQEFPYSLGFQRAVKGRASVDVLPPEDYGYFGVRFDDDLCLVMALDDLNSAARQAQQQLQQKIRRLYSARAHLQAHLGAKWWRQVLESQGHLLKYYAEAHPRVQPHMTQYAGYPRPPDVEGSWVIPRSGLVSVPLASSQTGEKIHTSFAVDNTFSNTEVRRKGKRMTIAVNTATIRRFYEALNLGDLAAAAECIAPDFFDHAITRELAYGREGFLGARTRSRHVLADITIEVQQLLATRNNYVVARVLIRARHVGDYLDIPATGRAFTMEAISIMRLHHGLIAEHWESSDVPGLLVQLHGRIVVEEDSIA